jgi:outer membrane protein OmpA-like peptidoglycan-associated protein
VVTSQKIKDVIMKYPLLASALSLLLGSGIAIANEEEAGTQQQQPQAQADIHAPASSVQDVNLFFEFDSAELKADAGSELQKLAYWAKCNTANAVILEGFADPTGSVEYNQKLSAERAAAVRQQLIDMGVPSRRIVMSVFGENGPSKPSHAEERRVTARAAGSPVSAQDLAG